VLNREAVRMAVRFGLAIGATISRRSIFARKNYFYPDLPKGYHRTSGKAVSASAARMAKGASTSTANTSAT
jgi:Asp-tRNA(Asn)/Glu-tRNA(Gln) amidotransferase B subunit